MLDFISMALFMSSLLTRCSFTIVFDAHFPEVSQLSFVCFGFDEVHHT